MATSSAIQELRKLLAQGQRGSVIERLEALDPTAAAARAHRRVKAAGSAPAWSDYEYQS